MDLIEHLEELSMLKFSEEEKQVFKSEFDTILKFVGQIEDVKLDEDCDDKDGKLLSLFRDDEVQESMCREDALLNAPCAKDGCYNSPLVIE